MRGFFFFFWDLRWRLRGFGVGLELFCGSGSVLLFLFLRLLLFSFVFFSCDLAPVDLDIRLSSSLGFHAQKRQERRNTSSGDIFLSCLSPVWLESYNSSPDEYDSCKTIFPPRWALGPQLPISTRWSESKPGTGHRGTDDGGWASLCLLFCSLPIPSTHPRLPLSSSNSDGCVSREPTS